MNEKIYNTGLIACTKFEQNLLNKQFIHIDGQFNNLRLKKPIYGLRSENQISSFRLFDNSAPWSPK
jgi:hypothetical protein